MKRWALVVPPHPIDAHRDQAHHLDAAGDDDVIGSSDDPLRGEIHRLLRGAAFAVERHRRHAFGEARGENRLPANVARLLGDLDHASGDHILDQFRIDARPSHQLFEDPGVEIDRMHAVEGAAGAASTEWRANDIDDDGPAHG